MKNKCTKYEAYFTFSSQDDFNNHLCECEACMLEHEKMQKVSSLIQEVKPHFLRKRRNNKLIKAACSILLLIFIGTGIGIVNNGDLYDTLIYGETLSAEDLGFPVDSYGLIMVE